MIVVLFPTDSLKALCLIARFYPLELDLEWAPDIVWLIPVEVVVKGAHPCDLEPSLFIITISVGYPAPGAPLFEFLFYYRHEVVSISSNF